VDDGVIEQCPTCGRCPDDWAERNSAKTLSSQVDRVAPYRSWRYVQGIGGVTDVDNIEWRLHQGVWLPVAVLELTRVDGNIPVPDSYRANVLTRFQRDVQGETAVTVARRLGCKAWVVLFRWDMSDLWVFNLTDSRGWWHLNEERYRHWLRSLVGRGPEGEFTP